MAHFLPKRLNQFFENSPTTELIQSFQLESTSFVGKIRVKFKTINMCFEVDVPLDFPMSTGQDTCIRFINADLTGYPHINLDDSVCLHTATCADIETKLQLEYDGLIHWISTYYVSKQADPHYQQLLMPIAQEPLTLLYHTVELEVGKQRYGSFKWGFINEKVGIVLGIGATSLKWAPEWMALPPQKGIWWYLSQPPTTVRRRVATHWDELNKIVSQSQLEYLWKQKVSTNTEIHLRYKWILLSYLTPFGITHALACLDAAHLPIEQNKQKVFKLTNVPILWHQTQQVDADLFFGRGRLPTIWLHKKILIIGIGAIGSSLAKILVRSGCLDLTLSDFDIVESGNICRSEYDLANIGESKLNALWYRLAHISPIAHIERKYISKALPNTPSFAHCKNELQTFDVIFDCSTDNEMALMLDSMDLAATIINLSMTDKAQQFICVAEKNIALWKHHIATALNVQPPQLYVGAGCAYPTFEANYLDIQVLLTHSLKQIVQQLEKGLPIQNFIMESQGANLNCYYFETYQLPNSYLKLIISKKILERIQKQSISDYPNETGGILMGSRIDDKTLFITEMVIPKDFDSSPNSYTREVADINLYLAESYHRSNGFINYLGEWHSHPNASAQFSQKDLRTMQKIANEPNTNNKNPLLLICGFNIKQFDLKFYILKNHKLIEYEKN